MGPLFDNDGKAPKPRRNGKSPEAQAATEALLRAEAHYKFRFESRFGFAPRINYGKDRRHLRDLLAAWGEAVVTELVDLFFASTDPRVCRSDYSVAALYALAQHLRIGQSRAAPPDERTVANAEAARKATKGNR